jgi:hypothetical protein
MADVGAFYGHLVHFATYCGHLVGIFYGFLVYFSRFGIFVPSKIWLP